MQIFANGLLYRKHQYVVAIDVGHYATETEEARVINHVLKNHNEPLECLPTELDQAIEYLIAKTKAILPPDQKLLGVHFVDLGPKKSILNKLNRKYADYGLN